MKIENIQLLDCTLRDGGHVNDAMFGKKVIKDIVSALSKTNIDLIELGFLKNGHFSEDESNYNKIEEARRNIAHVDKEIHCSVMIRPDWYDISLLNEADEVIDTIRFAFYFKDIELTKQYCRYAVEKGYRCILNPVNIMGYNDEKLKILLDEINSIRPYGATIVDTFGSIQIHDLEHIYKLFEERLSADITIGLHLHENMASSFQLAQHYLKIKKATRKTIIDGSLLGMGRIPGNLCIEMFLDYMHDFNPKYEVSAALEVISKHILRIKKEREWGYFPAYYFSGKYRIHRSYAEFLMLKEKLGLDDIYLILRSLRNNPWKDSFSEERAEKVYQKYMEEKLNG